MANGQAFVKNNSKDASLTKAVKAFEVLALFIDTPEHHIFVTTPFVILGQVCVTKISILEKANPATIKTVEFKPFCLVCGRGILCSFSMEKGFKMTKDPSSYRSGAKTKMLMSLLLSLTTSSSSWLRPSQRRTTLVCGSPRCRTTRPDSSRL